MKHSRSDESSTMSHQLSLCGSRLFYSLVLETWKEILERPSYRPAAVTEAFDGKEGIFYCSDL